MSTRIRTTINHEHLGGGACWGNLCLVRAWTRANISPQPCCAHFWNIITQAALDGTERDLEEVIMSRHVIMNPSGHSTFEFDGNIKTDLAEAERRFNKLVGTGYIPAEIRGDGTHHVPDKANRVFDPGAEETLFIPALRGG